MDEEDYDLQKTEYASVIETQARECMEVFFCDKQYWAGGAIAKSKLYRSEHVKVVMEMPLMDALAVAYYCLEKNSPDTLNTTKKNWDIHLCYDCLKQCAKRYVPKCHIGGILLVYLSLCHGVEFISVLKKLKEIKQMLKEKEAMSESKYC